MQAVQNSMQATHASGWTTASCAPTANRMPSHGCAGARCGTASLAVHTQHENQQQQACWPQSGDHGECTAQPLQLPGGPDT